AIESGNNKALNNLSWFYFEQAKYMNKSIQLITQSYSDKKNYYNTHTLAIVLLWAEQFSKSYEKFLQWLEYDDILEKEEEITIYLTLLMAKGQLYKAKEFFEIPEYDLINRYKPVWYALMNLMQDEFPNEIKKMGGELKESVDEILFKIDTLQEKYSLE
ncbi:MAG: hypothetical protein KAI17_20325, partial [Thiotrichaceae bacterium]|nr:hypothetical protein [Thiotrichaceae bacterium]